MKTLALLLWRYYSSLTLLLWSALSVSQSLSQSQSQSEPLLAFISITSAPRHGHLRHAARTGWLRPCIAASNKCEYRFFVDTPAHTHIRIHDEEATTISPSLSPTLSPSFSPSFSPSLVSPSPSLTSSSTTSTTTSPAPSLAPSLSAAQLLEDLLLENATYGDLVFRDACEMIMTRHSLLVNYGNSPPLGDNLFAVNSLGETVANPDYPLRRLYKIDWKVCFLKVIDKLFYNLDRDEVFTHVFVEDDSFVCTENLLFQLALVYQHSRLQAQGETAILDLQHFPFRAGSPMFDGFDDSSTIMHNRVARIFVKHYPSYGFDCGNIGDSTDSSILDRASWMSWGNSWMSRFCNWSQVIQERFNVTIIKPNLHCTAGKLNKWTIELGCLYRPIILHHHDAAKLMLHEEPKSRVWHMCEHMLLIDKVKDPQAMMEMWTKGSVANHFHDFSELFYDFNKSGNAWKIVLERLASEESRCKSTEYIGVEMRTALNQSHWWDDPQRVHADFPCLFELFEERSRRQLSIDRFVYGSERRFTDRSVIERFLSFQPNFYMNYYKT